MTRKPPKLQPLEPSFSLPLISFCPRVPASLCSLPPSSSSPSVPFLSFDPARFRSLTVVRANFLSSSLLYCSGIPLIFLSRSHFLTISFYSFRSLVDQLGRGRLKPLVVARELSVIPVLRSIAIPQNTRARARALIRANLSKR